jgi:hypothetical protein
MIAQHNHGHSPAVGRRPAHGVDIVQRPGVPPSWDPAISVP